MQTFAVKFALDALGEDEEEGQEVLVGSDGEWSKCRCRCR